MRSVAIVLATASLVAAAPAGSASADTAKLRRQMREAVRAGVPGVIVYARHGSRTVRLAAGAAIVRPRVPMRPTDRFRVGSITKTFVATVVVQLAQEGRLGLDDTVESHVPGLVPGGDAITLRQLLNHTSGLFDYLDDGDSAIVAPYVKGDFAHFTSPREIVAAATAHPPNFAPGTSFRYSNTGYIVLGLVVERVTGHSLEAEIAKRILVPLALNATTFDDRAARILGRHAHGYTQITPGGGLQDIDALSSSLSWAAGAVVSTAGDIMRFYRGLMRGRLLGRDFLRAMQTGVEIVPGELYGLGLWRSRSIDFGPQYRLPCADAVWGHNGGLAGWRSNAFITPDGRRQIVMLHNTDRPSRRMARALGRVLATGLCG